MTGESAHITGMYTLSELGAPCDGDATVVLVELLLTHARLGCLGAASAPSQAINRVVADQAATHDAPRALISLPHRVPSEACDWLDLDCYTLILLQAILLQARAPALARQRTSGALAR